MPDATRFVDGIELPNFLYGTAWKEDDTTRLTTLALGAGFRGIDTANQRKHYHEAAVGEAIAAAIAAGIVTREQLFLQTKFTFLNGQDHRLPYDPKSPIAKQVQQSFASSQQHLGVATIDSYLLHGPSRRDGLDEADWQAWSAMEELQLAGNVRFLGVSNVNVDQLSALLQGCRVRPRFVQNRCYAVQGWDRDVRAICAANGIVYQGFSLLTANGAVVSHAVTARIAARYHRTPAQIVFRLALQLGMQPITGTTDTSHMQEDLGVFDFQLDLNEVQTLEKLRG